MPNLNNQVSGSAIAFIDTLVENYQSLIAGVKPGTEVVVLDGKRDAIDQITQILGDRSNIDSIHIVSHGAPGSLQLGEGSVSLDDIEGDRNSLQQWFSQRTDSTGKNRPNILLYGCSVAAGETGKAFVKRLSELTGARVAASENLTGSVAKGGDWELEVSTGSIETPLVFEAEVLAGYEYVLSTFGDATTFPITDNLRRLATGDFNFDGNLDLAFAIFGNQDVSIALGDGTGQLGAASNFNTNSESHDPWSVAVGDFNQDGNSDLVTANYWDDNVSLLLGNGDGTFGAATTYFSVRSGPQSVAVADFNGDGNLDLATANNRSDNVSILQGNGNGTFGAATNLSVGSTPYFVVVGDFNNDGKPDLATANSYSDSVSIRLQNANGTFAPATNFTVGDRPSYIAIADFNGDNNPDLATSNESSDNVSILLGNGTGNFSAPTNFSVGSLPQAIASADFNADGKVDLATANYGSNDVSVLFGSGNGSFGTATNFAVKDWPTSIVVGDFNKDGLSDLATANFGDDNSSILLNISFPAVNFGAATYSATEGTADTVVNIPVTLGGTPKAAFTVPIVIDKSSSATLNSDYTISPTSITFPAGATGAALTQNVAVTIKPDNLPENAETAILNLGTITSGVADTTQQTTLTIADNGAVSYAIAAGTASIPEGNSGTTPLTFTATRSGGRGGASSVNYTIAGTTNLSDYNNIGGTSGATAATGTINFGTGETSKTITLDVLGDTLVEPDETIAVTLSSPTGKNSTPAITTATATTTITNDDVAGFTVNPLSGLTTSEVGGSAEFTVKLNAQPTANVTIGLTSSNTAEGTVSTNSLTFTDANYNQPQTITVSGVDDLVADGPQPYKIVTAAAVSTDANYNNLDPDDVTVTNSDNETPGITVNPTTGLTTGESGTKANFTVVLNTQPLANVTIGLNSNNRAEGTVSTNSLTFTPANWNTPQQVTVTGVDDSIADGDSDYKIVTAAAVSTDANYSNRDVADVSLINQDNDTAGVSITPTQTTATEGGANGSYGLKLTSQPIAPVTITLTTGNQIGDLAPVTFTANNWNVAQTVTVQAIDDRIIEGAHSGNITHSVSSTDTKYNALVVPGVTVAIADNDVPPRPLVVNPPVRLRSPDIIINPAWGLVTTETGGTDQFTIKLNSQPTADVKIDVRSNNEAEGVISTESITFNSTNWNEPQTVTVTGVDDSVADGDKTYQIVTAPAVSADRNYSGLNAADVAVTNTDNVPLPPGEKVNRPPVLTIPFRPQDLSLQPGWIPDQLQFTFQNDTFTDPDPNDTLTYTADLYENVTNWQWRNVNGGRSPVPTSWERISGLPQGLNFDPSSRTFSIEDTLPRDLYWIGVTATDAAGASDIAFFDIYNPGKGRVIDGYIAGATVFFDANKNGVKDANESSTITGPKGEYELDIPWATFDKNQNGEIDAEEGNIVAFGGTDTATGLPLETPVTAPADATVVTLLTSLVVDLIDKGVAPETAQTLVKSSLGIPADVDITDFDPIAATNNNQPGGVQVLSSMVKVQNFITQTSALINGASSAASHDIVKAVVNSITNQIQSGTVLNLSNAAALEPIIQEAAAKIQQIDPSFNSQQFSQITSQAATVMATANQRIDAAVSNPTGTSIPESLARLQQIALGPTTQDFKEVGAGNKPISQVVADNTGTALDSRIEAVVLPGGIATPVVSGDADLGSNSPQAILGTNGDDILTGDSGNNVLMGMRGNDSLDGGLGNDSVFGGKGSDTLLGSSGDDALFAGRGADILNGDDGNDILYGGKGDDLLTGGLGVDILIGGMGVDKFLLSTNSGSDTVTDFEVGKDLLVLGNGLTFSQLTIAQDSGATLIRLAQTGEILASIAGVSANSISAENFRLI